MKKAVFVSVLVLFSGFAAAQSFEDEPVMGSDDANVTMVMYEDFQCPFCKRFETNTFPEIESNYVETGELKVVWKDFPMPELHPWAEDAATTMECVYREGGDDTFWSVKEKVFRNQDNITESNVQSMIKSWAGQQGLNSSAIDSCLQSGEPLEEVREDREEGEEEGISGTPGFLINGKKVVGAQPYSRFEEAIDNAPQDENREEQEENESQRQERQKPESGGEQGEDNSDLRQKVRELETQITELREKVDRLERTVEQLQESEEDREREDAETESGEAEEESRSGDDRERGSGKERQDNSGDEESNSQGNSGGGGIFGFVGGLLG